MNRRWGTPALGLVLLLLVASVHPIVSASTPKASVDLKPSTFTTSYASSNDAALYDTLSRTTSLNRAPELWIIDGMLGV